MRIRQNIPTSKVPAFPDPIIGPALVDNPVAPNPSCANTLSRRSQQHPIHALAKPR